MISSVVEDQEIALTLRSPEATADCLDEQDRAFGRLGVDDASDVLVDADWRLLRLEHAAQRRVPGQASGTKQQPASRVFPELPASVRNTFMRGAARRNAGSSAHE
jgi:hypothetical protein